MLQFKKIWGIWSILSLIGVVIFFMSQPSDKKICFQQYEKERNNSYIGIVTAKFIDSTEHNYKTLILNENQTIWMNWDKSGLYEFIQPSDSIAKDSGSYEVKLFRDSIEYKFQIDFGCNDKD